MVWKVVHPEAVSERSRDSFLNEIYFQVFWQQHLLSTSTFRFYVFFQWPTSNIKSQSHFHHAFHHVPSHSMHSAFFNSNRLTIAMPNFAVLFKWMHHSSGRSNEWLLMTHDAKDRPIVTWSLLVTFLVFCWESLVMEACLFYDIADIETNRFKIPTMPILRSNLQMSGLFSPRYADEEDRMEWWPWILEGHIRWHLCQL